MNLSEPTATPLPEALQQIVKMFAIAPKQLRLQLLLEYSKKVPPLPEELKESGRLERVHECQTPFFLATSFEADKVMLHFDAPQEAPTTRGFAGILYEGLNGASAGAILALPNDFYEGLKLAELISPLRLRGMEGILFRLKRQVRQHQAEAQSEG
ncbi:MAG: SufE family protein [Deinococcales bacterium]